MQVRDAVHLGDALEVLREIPSGVVQCCVTSPPYWGLRDYGHRRWFSGDNPDCEHGEVKEAGYEGHRGNKGQVPQTKWPNQQEYPQHSEAKLYSCQQCGAWYGQIGLEPTPEEYVRHLVEVFREVRRVLRDDGTFWLNLGDSWANDSKWGGTTSGKHAEGLHGTPVGRGKRTTGLKSKDLVGIPWRVAFALQDDGWFLRSDIIWEKGNPLPESVKDRPTKSHEYIFLLTKNANYFYDIDAIREPHTSSAEVIPWQDKEYDQDMLPSEAQQAQGKKGRPNGVAGFGIGGRNKRSVWHHEDALVRLRSDLDETIKIRVITRLIKLGLL
jgi:DNA modification methylase